MHIQFNIGNERIPFSSSLAISGKGGQQLTLMTLQYVFFVRN